MLFLYQTANMIESTNAILLNSVKYGESSLILQCYTSRFGRISLLAKGARKKSKGKPKLIPQPLQILSISISKKETRELSILREMEFSYMATQTGVDIRRSAIAIFIADLLTHSLREEDRDDQLYSFLHESIIALDTIVRGVENFHLYFVVRLSEYLGLSPATPTTTGNGQLDYDSGIFIPEEPAHDKVMDSFNSDLFVRFANTDFNSLHLIEINGYQRNAFLSLVLNYYSHHLPGSGNLKSLPVLREIFS